MADVRWKDLCLDAQDPDRVAPFWAEVLGLADERQDGGDHVLRGAEPGETVWVNRVPEPQQVKNRVHLDVRFPDGQLPQAPVVRHQDDQIGWDVLADPEGLQFCAFGPHPQHPEAAAGAFELVVDAADPLALATWWGERLGVAPQQRAGAAWVWLEGLAGFPFRYWVFASVPELGTVKNRMHWDVALTGTDLAGLVHSGATVLTQRGWDRGWTVLADPEGNEFCAFPDEGRARSS